MKVLLSVTLIVAIYSVYVHSEVCKGTDVSKCNNTQCATNVDHVHIECVEDHCTCVKDLRPCLTQSDCDNGRCIESHGHRANYHCLDGNCKCLEV